MKTWIAVAVLVLASACNYNHVKEAPAGPGDDQLRQFDTEAVDYEIAKLVIDSRCVECHNSHGRAEKGLVLDSYDAVRSNHTLVELRVFATPDRPMPPQGLSDREKAILQGWADLGYPEKLQGPVEKPDAGIGLGPVTFAKLKDKVFAAKCLDCHSPPNPEKGLDLTSPSMTKAKALELFDRTVLKQDMPVAPYPTLTANERKAIMQWINLGMPE